MATACERAALILVLIGSFARGQAAEVVSKHSQFIFKDGLISPIENPELRLNAKGGELKPGDPLILWPCGPHDHELFSIPDGDGLIKLQVDPQLCLNAAGGISANAGIVLWPCSQSGNTVEHEQFEFHPDGRIKLKGHPDMCLNAQGGAMESGANLILYQCHDEPLAHELFVFDGGMIKLKDTELHLNVKGGNMTEGSEIVLWHCEPGRHELFELGDNGQLHLQSDHGMCVNSEQGLGAGNRLVIWPCSEVPGPNEVFQYDTGRQVIYAKDDPALGFNVKQAAMQPGTEILMWPLVEKDEL